MQNERIKIEEAFLLGKNGDTLCGDAVFIGENFVAVIDGATPKGKLLWNGQPGDIFISHHLAQQIDSLPPDIDGVEAIKRLNSSIADCCRAFGRDDLSPEERLQASIVIYSKSKNEIWSFGDCQFRINNAVYDERKRIDMLLGEVRSFYLHTEKLLGKTDDELRQYDPAREYLMPLLKRQSMFANTDHLYGYPVLNGCEIQEKHVRIVPVSPGACVVLASDGYPKLLPTLEESEAYLQKIIREDPLCMHTLLETKGMKHGNISHDDRSYLRFYAKEEAQHERSN